MTREDRLDKAIRPMMTTAPNHAELYRSPAVARALQAWSAADRPNALAGALARWCRASQFAMQADGRYRPAAHLGPSGTIQKRILRYLETHPGYHSRRAIRDGLEGWPAPTRQAFDGALEGLTKRDYLRTLETRRGVSYAAWGVKRLTIDGLTGARSRVASILRGGGASAPELVPLTGLTLQSVRRALRELERSGLVERSGVVPGTGGRRLPVFVLAAEGAA